MSDWPSPRWVNVLLALGMALLLWACGSPLKPSAEEPLSANATMEGNQIQAWATIRNVSTVPWEVTHTCAGIALKTSSGPSAPIVWYDLRDPRRGLSFERACTLELHRVTLEPGEEISPPELRTTLLLEKIPEIGSSTWYVWLGFWLDGEERFLSTGLVIEI